MGQKPKTHKSSPHQPARGTSSQRGYDAGWQRFRKQYLAEHPLCVLCEAEGRAEAATVIDHIRAVRGPNDSGFYDEANLRSLCKSCHSRKTASHDGGFGNA